MNRKVIDYIRKTGMIRQGDVVIAGVSGGADSVCLLLLLEEYRQLMGFQLHIVHVEHGIRGDGSLEDARFVEELCRRKNLPCRVFHVDVPGYAGEHRMGLEEAARVLRYRQLGEMAAERVREGVEPERIRIALAHHVEDNAETVLFQMVRGSGLAGLRGMQPVRRADDGFFYIRPLLQSSRAEVEQFLEARGQMFREDGTNRDVSFSRNRLRHRVFPELERINAQAAAHIGQTAAQLSKIQDYMECRAKEAMEQLAHRSGDGRELRLQIDGLRGFHPALREEILRRAILEVAGHGRDITSVHILSAAGLMEHQSGRKVVLPHRVEVRREYGTLVLTRGGEASVPADEGVREVYRVAADELRELEKTGGRLSIALSGGEAIVMRVFPYDGDASKIVKKTYTKWFDYDKITEGAQIRHRMEGDRICIDSCGHHQKLKKYLKNCKVPIGQRERLWILADADEVIWLVGGRISDSYKVSDDTVYILEVSYRHSKDK